MPKIKIRQHTFQFPDRYFPGQTIILSQAEAQAFNQLFAENVRNNVDALVIKACAVLEPGSFLSVEIQGELQAEIARYANSYQFQFRHSPKPKLSPLEISLQEVAEERAREDGLNEQSHDWFASVEEYKQRESCHEEAARRASARAQAVTDALSELF